MDKLFKGIIEFSEKDYQEYEELFKKIGNSQKPHTLFIGCSDSRIVPNLITKTLPGELFVIRNIANIVPYYRETEEFVSTTSAIEYALLILNVENIVVCGHSNCGGCDAFYNDESFFKNIPHVKKWLELGIEVKTEVEKRMPNADVHVKKWLTEQINVVKQMENLFTYPFIKERYEKGTVKIFGWYYVIETGKIYNYDTVKNNFQLVT
jgi:carbonic anhydrase